MVEEKNFLSSVLDFFPRLFLTDEGSFHSKFSGMKKIMEAVLCIHLFMFLKLIAWLLTKMTTEK